MNDKEVTAFLADINIHRFYDGMALSGNIYNDRRGHFEDGVRIRTAFVTNVDHTKGVVETTNSVYDVPAADMTDILVAWEQVQESDKCLKMICAKAIS